MKLRILIMGTLLISFGMSQTLEETLQQMAEDNAKGYLGPAVTAFGMGVNSGTFHTAKPHKMLGFDVTLNVAATSIGDAGLTYDFVLPNADIDVPLTLGAYGSFTVSINPDQVYSTDRTAPTLFGSKDANTISVDATAATDVIANQLAADPSLDLTADQIKTQFGSEISTAIAGNIPSVTTPAGFDFPAFPMVMPQVSLGLPMSIELTLRGFPEFDLGDMGKLSFVGFGGKIGINQFIPIPNIALPQVSVGYYLTSLKIGDVLDASNSILTLQASKSIPFLTVYGGFGLESSSMDVSYTYVDQVTNTELPIKFSLDGQNSFRTIVGARLKLAIISINADYNVGEFNTLNLGVGLTLR